MTHPSKNRIVVDNAIALIRPCEFEIDSLAATQAPLRPAPNITLTSE